MKKVSILMAIVTVCFISCTSSKKNMTGISAKDFYKDNPYAQPYIESPYLITEEQARVYLNAFRKHNYRVTRKKILDTAWSSFDHTTLQDLLKDDKTDSVVFFMGAYPRWDKSIPREKKRHPFVVLKSFPKPDPNESGKGGFLSSLALSKPLYFRPKDICPPPNTGCKIP